MSASRPIDDATAEALLTGRTVADEFQPLVTALHTCRGLGHRPVPPSQELAAQMATGVFGPATAAKRRAGRHALAEPWFRRLSTAPLGTLAASAVKIAGVGIAVKAGIGAGVAAAAVAVATAGLTGVLPEPAQDRFDHVVETVVPHRGPQPPREPGTPAGPSRPDGAQEPDHRTDSRGRPAGRDDPEGGGPQEADPSAEPNFGQWVSEDAQDDAGDDQEAAEQARERAQERRNTDRPGVGEGGKPASPAPGPPGRAPGDRP